MYKNIISIVILAAPAIAWAAEVQDGDILELNVGRTKPTNPLDPHPKSPIEIPLVYQDGNTLTFATPCTGCTLQLLDADDDVVYETTVASGTTSIILPDATLLGGTGTYELRLIYGDIYFYADITL